MEDTDGLEWFEANEMLMWHVTGATAAVAEARVDEFVSRVHHHHLGECEKYPAGLGASWWFDLTLAKRVDQVFIIALFGRSPDHVY